MVADACIDTDQLGALEQSGSWLLNRVWPRTIPELEEAFLNSGRSGDVHRESSRGGGEKRDGVPHLAAIGALSAHPRVLHHVVGVWLPSTR